jgi:hypothetical protein
MEGDPVTTPTYRVGTTEFITVTVTADVELDTQTVAVSIDQGATWLPCTWTGDDPSTTRTARTTDPVTFTTAHASGTAYVKVTDDPEAPVIDAGYFNVFDLSS